MPDPWWYSQAMAATAAISLFLVLIAGRWQPKASSVWLQRVVLLALSVGHLVGYGMLGLYPAWPPASALDRMMVVILPAVVCVEWLRGLPYVSGKVIWILRLAIATVTGRILLHGSVYLSGPNPEWPTVESLGVLAVGAGVLIVVGAMLSWLFERSPGPTIPIALAMAMQSAGVCIMLAGYIEGGAAALPVTASLLGVIIATAVLKQPGALQPAIGIGVVQLFGLIWIGRFFGSLTTGPALVMMLAPLLCLVTEIPLIRRQKPWIVGILRLALVAVPLVVVLWLAKQKFDREMAPLLGQVVPTQTTSESGMRTDVAIRRAA